MTIVNDPGRLVVPREPRLSSVSPAAVRAWAESDLGSKLSTSPSEVLAGAVELNVAAGGSISCYSTHPSSLLAVMVEGLAREYAMSAEGREVTVRYVGESDVLGLPAALVPGAFTEANLAVAVQAITPCRVLRLSVSRFRHVMTRDAQDMWLLFRELTLSLVTGTSMLAENVFLPLRCRVAAHMLDLAMRDGDRLVVKASQQDLAGAVGSVRAVVSRVILRLRDEGLVHRDGAVYVIDDPAGLHALAKCPS